MKTSKKLIFMAMILQASACLAMNEDQKTIDGFVHKQLTARKEPITFFWPIEDDLKDCFPQQKLQLPQEAFIAIHNSSKKLVDLKAQSTIKAATPVDVKTIPVVFEKKENPIQKPQPPLSMVVKNKQPKQPVHKQKQTIPKVRLILRDGMAVPHEYGTIEYDIQNLVTRGKNLQELFSKQKIKNKINGPYHYKQLNLFADKVNSGNSGEHFIYVPHNETIVVIDQPFMIFDKLITQDCLPYIIDCAGTSGVYWASQETLDLGVDDQQTNS